ncbi:MAG: NfeD family protein [Candidatus Caldatribacteriaceae bacterium]
MAIKGMVGRKALWVKIRRVFLGILLLLFLAPFALAAQPIFWVPLKDVPEVGAVEWGLASFVKRALQEAQKQNAQAVVFEIDTFGGRVDAMLFIQDLIFRSPVKTVAFVNPRAWSAGVFLALSCERIFMAPDGSMGASEPRSSQEDVSQPDPKTVSALRAQIEALAQARGRDPLLFAAMVDREVAIEGVKEKGTLLTLPAQQALELGAADGIARKSDEVLAQLGLEGPVVTLSPSWSETLARIVTHPAVAPLLILLAFGGIFLEIMTPGFGAPGIVGLTSFFLFFGGRYLAGLSGWEPLLLFLAGIVLLALELLVIPGFGAAGVTGIGALAVSLYLALRTARIFFAVAIAETFLYLAILGAIFLCLLFFLPQNPIWRKIGLWERSPVREKEKEPSPYEHLLGKEGVTKTVLRPAGIAEIEGITYDVVSRGEFIEKGVRVVVDAVQGNNIIVRQKGGKKLT